MTPFLLGQEAPDLARPIFLQRPYYGPVRPGYDDIGYGFGLRSGRWKYFEALDEGRSELYDLERDPRERVNLSQRVPRKREQMSERIRAWRLRQKGGLARSNLSEGDEAALDALGYAR